MTEAFHLNFTAADPESVMLLFDTIGARFSFQPSERGLSYREERAGDEDVSLARVEVEGSYSSWGDTQMFSVIQRTAGRCDWSTRTESGTGIGAPVLITPSSPTLFVVDSLQASNVYLTADLVQDIAGRRTPTPSFRDGLQVQRVLQAVERSAVERCWQDVQVSD